MAKIYAIKCPQCGSPERTPTKKDHYKCESCGTEYFVETNDIHHFHFHHVEKEEKLAPKGYKAWMFAIVILTAAVMFFFKENERKPTKPTVNNVQNQRSQNVVTPPKPLKEEKKSWRYTSDSQIIPNKKNEPVLILIGHYAFARQNLDDKPIDIQFINLHTMEEGKIQTLPDFDTKLSSPNISTKLFKTGEYYVVQNEKMAYLIDMESQSFQPVNESFAKQQPEFSKGIIKISFSRRYGDGFNVMLPNGKQYLYFPYTNQLTNDDKAFDYVYQPNKNKAPQNAPEITTINFTSVHGRDIAMNSDDKIKLVEYTQKTPYGYPMIKPSFYDLMKKDRGVKNFLSKKDMDDARIIKWRDITPERDYFSPALFCHNNEYGLISFSENVLEDSTRYVQLLNLKTGEPVWTWTFNLDKHSARYMNLKCNIDQAGTTYVFDTHKNILTILDIKGNISGEKKWD